MKKTTIYPETELYHELMSVEKPGRYVGGEYGCVKPDTAAPVRIAVCFPDLYEIGMSNLAVRIMYQLFNSIADVSCERVFAPAPDFEALLRGKSLPLYSLESGAPLYEFDIIAFSIGYELSATNILNVLETGGVPIMRNARTPKDPIVIGGGPGVTNPAPFGAFFDAIFIGEIEGEAQSLFSQIAAAKKTGASRDYVLNIILSHDSFWNEEKNSHAQRAAYMSFGTDQSFPLLPVPSVRTAQDHGVVEIMRGCPNGCRFCHAGIFYRPFREKNPKSLFEDIKRQIDVCGYREVTISSLSTGDYSGVVGLVRELNRMFKNRRISFSLPSLRIDSFTLPLLSEISTVRKSGITFAVETPIAEWQQGLNKEVPLEKTIQIMQQARELGWRLAKFYFMLGLPVSADKDETEPILDFLYTVQKKSGMNINVNVGTFVPKPHTPYQWAKQISEQEALRKIHTLKNKLRGSKIQLKYNSPFSSILEGTIARGSSKTAGLIAEAYKRGARMDAWEEYLDRDLWKKVIQDAEWNVLAETTRARDVEEVLPWDGVELGVSKHFLAQELERSQRGELTEACNELCAEQCGVCTKKTTVKRHEMDIPDVCQHQSSQNENEIQGYIDFCFRKEGRAAFLSHLNVMRVFERAFLRAGIPVRYTEGFNPKPKLEFASPLALGIDSEHEIARVEIISSFSQSNFVDGMSKVLHSGMKILDANVVRKNGNRRLKSLMSRYWGSEYIILPRNDGGPSLIQKAKSLLEQYSSKMDIGAYITCLPGEDAIRIRIQHKNKDTSIKMLLESISQGGHWHEKWRAKRLKTLFKTDVPDEFLSFFN